MDKEFAEAFKEEIEKEASTYRDRTKDDEKKKKRHFAFGGKKDKKKAEKALKKSFKKGGAPEIQYEEVEMDEAKGTAFPATIDTLRKIVKDKQNQVVMFKSGQARVDLFTASAMVQVYDALKKPDMKKTFEKMITDKAGFMKTQAFAMKMVG